MRVELVAHIPRLVDTLGFDSAQVLRAAGLRSQFLSGTGRRIGYHAAGRLLEESARATGLAHFGLLAGEHFEPAVALGDVIELMLNAPTIEVALRAFVLQHHLNDSGAVPVLMPVNRRRSALAYTVFAHDVPGLDTFYDAAIAYGVQILRLLAGRNWQPAQVRLAHRRPADATPYTRLFGPHVLFDAHVYAIEFAPDLLKRTVAGANPHRYAVLRDEMQQRLRRERIGFADQVRRALLPMILTGAVSASRVATLFSIHQRVLRSRLAAEGITFRQLLQVTRLEVAAQLLRSTQLPAGRIGNAVGYSDPPSFVRAFRTRFGGVTPGEWRVQGMGNIGRSP